MTSTTSDRTTPDTSASESDLITSEGRTTIADAVVSKIAGIATRDVSGVWALGGGAARAVGVLRDVLPGASADHSQGISVEVGEKQAAIDVSLVAEYGVAIADLASGVRRNVIAAIERMTGLEVTEVNIAVTDVHVDSDEDDSSDEAKDANSQPRAQ